MSLSLKQEAENSKKKHRFCKLIFLQSRKQ